MSPIQAPRSCSKSRKDYNFLQLSAKNEHMLCSCRSTLSPAIGHFLEITPNKRGMKELTRWEMQFDTPIRQRCSHSFNHCMTLQPHCLRITEHDCTTVCMTKRMHKHTLRISILVKIYIHFLCSDVGHFSYRGGSSEITN